MDLPDPNTYIRSTLAMTNPGISPAGGAVNNSIIQLIVLGAIAVFLILKLRSVLGTRAGFEKPPVVAPVTGAPVARRSFEVIEGGPDHDITDHAVADSATAKALAQMKQAEPSFVVVDFLKGARTAYEMILTAFDAGEVDRIRAFLGPDVAHAFDEAAAHRKQQGLTVQTTIIGIRDIALDEAQYDATTRRAEVAIRYQAELTRVVRDANGAVVEGSATEMRRQRDTWTFARVMGAADPNWQLIATGD
jgi:predicted lipid-binding transport protein (Tim44 family)